jgi:hypothetical protein
MTIVGHKDEWILGYLIIKGTKTTCLGVSIGWLTFFWGMNDLNKESQIAFIEHYMSAAMGEE